VLVLLVVCVATTFLGWAAPNNWNVQEGTVGRIGVWEHGEWWRLITSPFLHANLTHLYFNMFALWFLGREIDSSLGTPRFLAIYFAAALGGGLMVVAAGQERTLGASGAIYGLMGASLYFGLRAFKAGYPVTAKRMLVATGALVGLNLLLSFSIPFISIAGHVGGLITGFAVAAALGVPQQLIDAWALSDRCPPRAAFTYDVNAGRFSYHGPVGFALRENFITERATAATRAAGWAPYVDAGDLNPDSPVDCYVDDPYPLLLVPVRPATVSTAIA
jgi:membrane associated rhomboid family serine protease